MNADDALKVANRLRDEFSPRERTLELCRRYGYQVRKSGDPAWEDSKVDSLEPLECSFPASRAWRLAMYLHANTIGVGQSFFTFVPDESRGSKDVLRSSRDYLAGAGEKVMKRIMDTNFSAAAVSAFNDVAVIGTAITFVDYDKRTKNFRFENFRVGSGTYYGHNSKGSPDIFCRFYKLNARQAVEEFGDCCSERILEDAANADRFANEFEFVWLVYPRGEFGEVVDGSDKTSRGKAYCSLIIEVGTRRVVREGGFDFFPFSVLCWQQRDGKPYGWSPIEMSLPDIFQMFELQRQVKDAVKKQVNPPVIVPATWENLDMTAGSVNLVDQTVDLGNKLVPLPVPVNLPLLSETINVCERNITFNMLLDAFEALTPEMRYMTATETNGRLSQAVRAIAPLVVNVHHNYFSPLLRYVFNLMVKNGEIERPVGVKVEDVVPKYISVLDTMVLEGTANRLLNFVGSLMNLVQAFSGLEERIGCYVDLGGVIRSFADKFNVPAGVLYSDEEAAARVEALAQARAEAAQAEQMASYVKPIDMQKNSESGSPAARSFGNIYGFQ